MPRLFVAIEIPEPARGLLMLLGGGLPGARWVPRDQLHLTLSFLGDVDGGTVADLRLALGRIRARPFDSRVRHVGHFPLRGQPTTLWAGIDHGESLESLQAAVENAARSAGLVPEARKFHAHVTLARLKGSPPRRVAEWLAGNNLFETEPFRVESFFLFASTLTPKGPIHEVVEEFPLTETRSAPAAAPAAGSAGGSDARRTSEGSTQRD